MTVNLAAGTGIGGDAQGDTLTGIENLYGTTFDDTLIGDAGANDLRSHNGNDTIRGGAGADNINGGAGVDTADYSTSSAGVTINLATGTGAGGDAQGDTLAGFENVTGSTFNDTLIGDAGANDLRGDVGDDVIRGGAGADRIGGAAGVDTADYSTSSAGVTIDLAAGTGTGGDAQGDTLFFIENRHRLDLQRHAVRRCRGQRPARRGRRRCDPRRRRGRTGSAAALRGVDTADYSTSAAGVTIDLAAGTGTGGDAQGDTLF